MAVVPVSIDTETVRAAYPALRDVVYLNVGSYGLMPEPAIEAFEQAFVEMERYGVASQGRLDQKIEAVRSRLAELLGCEAAQVALTGNATDGTNLVLAGLDWQPGDEVITTDQEHASVLYPLLHLQRCRGVHLHCMEVSSDPETLLARCEALRTPRTRLLIFSHVTCETGTRLPAAELCRWAAQHQVRTLIDGAQSFGVFPLDVAALGCDYYTSNGHKWLSGPKGTGLFYARPERMAELCPAHVGAGSLERADVAQGVADLWPSGQRFEYGTRAQTLYVGLGASLDWLAALGWDAIEQHIRALSSDLKQQVLARPSLRLLTPMAWEQSSGLTSFEVLGHDASQVSTALRERWSIHVRVVSHYNAVRVATAHFNDSGDLAKLMAALDSLAAG